jgi:hypothetical protein
MARSAIGLLRDADLRGRMAAAARAVAHEQYCDARIVPLYEAYYQEILSRTAI